ncbi:MAG: 50S ribosomal protein L10 [Bacteroidales bacterium]|nr:50S ribosomal protein L10 [Bacteroidales bacterium]
MKKELKAQLIDSLSEKINNASHFYLTDIADLNAEATSSLRRKCFEKNIQLEVVKNTLIKLALEKADGDFEPLYNVLKGSTSIMFTEVGNAPAKLIKEIRQKSEKPLIKGAYVEERIYIGDNQLDALSSIKSKEEVIGDIINILQSPIKNVLGALQSAPNTIGGLVKTLQERAE